MSAAACRLRGVEVEAGLPLRLAQRAFAALFDQLDSEGTFQGAQLRGAARRAWATLPAGERMRFSCWLALQLASTSARGAMAHRALAGVDSQLAVAVDVALVRVFEERRVPASARDA